MINTLKKHFINNKFLYLIIFIYIALRIINLTSFPLFNDESIYLDWGQREINKPGFLFYSLYDAKPPLLMWIFGIAQNLLPDPVFAGRIVSVFAGLLTLLGIYKLTKLILDKHTALMASFVYLLIPLFSFYDRQALMEAAVASCGVWSAYFLIKCISHYKRLDFIYLGIILGIGYFIKSSMVLFLISVLIILFINAIKSSKYKFIFENTIILGISFIAIIFLLIINPGFWATLSTNTRFVFSLEELLKLPIQNWIQNIFENFKIALFYITPVVLTLGILGIFKIFKSKNIINKYLCLYFILGLVLETLLVKSPSDRYLIAFFPLIAVFTAIFIHGFLKLKNKFLIGIFLTLLVIFTSLPITLLQIFNQVSYFKDYGKISGNTYLNYLDTFTTGYGLNEVFNYIEKDTQGKKVIVGIGENTGNPESAAIVHFSKNPNIQTVYFDSRLFNPEIFKYDCINVGLPLYFISRENQQVGLNKFLENIKFVKDPYGANTTGIFTLKTNCKGKTANLYLQQN